MSAADIRLGHAIAPLGDERAALREAIDVAAGRVTLQPRAPRVASVVLQAEQWLGASPRPVYAYVGDLHPALGTIGLIVDRGWADHGAVQGASRCDSGGLAGGLGEFAAIPAADRQGSLASLSFPQCGDDVGRWPDRLEDEIAQSQARGADGYVDGDVPDASAWGDARSRALAAGPGPHDRRLWTWELRLGQGPAPEHDVALALSAGAFKEMELLRVDEPAYEPPPHMRVLVGTTTRTGVEPFATREARAALRGR